MTSKRPFGTKRTLPSGRVQASYVGPDRKRHLAPRTFKTKPQAEKYLKTVEAQILLGQWAPEESHGGEVGGLFGEFAARHIEVQVNRKTGRKLEASTRAHYRRLLATHLSPFADLGLGEISPSIVSDWWAEASESGHLTTLSKAYKLLKAVMERAVSEGHIDKNPCIIQGPQNASSGKDLYTPSRAEVAALLKEMNPRYLLLCVLMANGGLRFEEVTALTLEDFEMVERDGLEAFNIMVTKAVGWAEGKSYVKPPKSAAGTRVVRLRPELTQQIKEHLKEVQRAGGSLLFPAERSKNSIHLQHSVLNNNFKRAIKRAGLSNRFSPHSLRRYFGSEYAKTGANWVEIGEALGDSSYVAVRRYVHATGRDEDLLKNLPPTI